MLTVNADGFPVLKRFHKPSDEKRKRAACKDKNLRTAEIAAATLPKFTAGAVFKIAVNKKK